MIPFTPLLTMTITISQTPTTIPMMCTIKTTTGSMMKTRSWLSTIEMIQ